jgi:hypothetical protein
MTKINKIKIKHIIIVMVMETVIVMEIIKRIIINNQ